MTAVAGAAPPAGLAPACPQCSQAMEVARLEGHYGKQVALDVCAHCNVVWFDEFESVALSGLGWIGLLRRMQEAMADQAGPLRRQLDCPRCALPLKPVQNLTRFGRFATLECARRHGHLQSFSLLLSERGLVRPLGHLDFQALLKEGRTPCCLNCGGPLQRLTEQCGYCESPLVVLDMPRLFTALLMRFGEPLPQAAAQRMAWPCRGCGAPLEPTRTTACDRCEHPVVVPSVVDLRPILDQAEPLLRAALPREGRSSGRRRPRGDASATMAHRFAHHAWDLLNDGGSSGGIPTWVGLVLLAAAVWFFWF